MADTELATIEEFNLKKYEATKADLQKKALEYQKLTIKDVNDKEGLEAVRTARIELKNDRIGVEKFFKMAKDFLNAKKTQVTDAEKEVLLLIEPIEKELQVKEKAIEEEKARIKKEKEEAESKRTQERFDKLYAVKFSGSISYLEMSMKSDEDFNALYEDAKNVFDIAEKNRIAEEERVEQERIAEEARKLKEKEETDKRLADIEAREKKQKEEDDRIASERKAIDDEKARIQREKDDEALRKQAEEDGRKKAQAEAETERLKKEQEDRELEAMRKQTEIDSQKRLEKEKKYKDWLKKYEGQYDRIVKEEGRIVLVKEVSEFKI